MPYVSLEELCENVPQAYLIAHMTDEQMQSAFRDAYMSGEAYDDVSCRVNMFLHHCIEGTDMMSEYTIDEQCPQRFEGVPDKGKMHDAVEKHVKRAFAAGIEYAIQWALSEIDVYDWKR